MPAFCGYSWSSEIHNAADFYARQHNVPLHLILATIAVESGFNPNAAGDEVFSWFDIVTVAGVRAARIADARAPGGFWLAWEGVGLPNRFFCSHGLLQLNGCGGQGAGYLRGQLVDPIGNLAIGTPALGSAFATCAPLFAWVPPQDREFICCFAGYSGHPGFVPCADARVTRLLDAWKCMFDAVGPTQQGCFLEIFGLLPSVALLALRWPWRRRRPWKSTPPLHQAGPAPKPCCDSDW